MAHSFPNSTAIESISDVVDNKVTINWKNGSSYIYSLSNAEQFMKSLSEVVNSRQSIGRFVNQQIQENVLQLA